MKASFPSGAHFYRIGFRGCSRFAFVWLSVVTPRYRRRTTFRVQYGQQAVQERGCKHIKISAFPASKSINAYMKNSNYSLFLTKTVSRITRIAFKANTLPQQIHPNYVPPPVLLLTKSLPGPIEVRRIGKEVDRRKCGHVREGIGGWQASG